MNHKMSQSGSQGDNGAARVTMVTSVSYPTSYLSLLDLKKNIAHVESFVNLSVSLYFLSSLSLSLSLYFCSFMIFEY